MTIILGIDPGSRITGYGLIEQQGSKLRYLASGCIRTKADSMPARLAHIHTDLNTLVQQFQPGEAALEQVFVHQNPAAALKLGQARGIVLLMAAIHGLPMAEYSAREVKRAMVGYGAADKSQMQYMVCQVLQLNKQPQQDAADALAIAICHAHLRQSQRLASS